jgi:hypothetical protein
MRRAHDVRREPKPAPLQTKGAAPVMKLYRIPTRKSHGNRAYKGRGMQLGRASTAKNGCASNGEYK